MSENPLVTFARDFFATMDRHDWPAVRAMLHPGHRFHMPMAPGPLPPDEHVAMTRSFVDAFPDFRHTIEQQFASGDRVVTMGLIHLTHEGEFNGIPPTGARIDCSFINVIRVEDQQNAEEWVQMDTLAILRGVGVVPDNP